MGLLGCTNGSYDHQRIDGLWNSNSCNERSYPGNPSLFTEVVRMDTLEFLHDLCSGWCRSCYRNQVRLHDWGLSVPFHAMWTGASVLQDLSVLVNDHGALLHTVVCHFCCAISPKEELFQDGKGLQCTFHRTVGQSTFGIQSDVDVLHCMVVLGTHVFLCRCFFSFQTGRCAGFGLAHLPKVLFQPVVGSDNGCHLEESIHGYHCTGAQGCIR
mmetsp:Transcript_23594/g.57847  ORF Transcript_23594/g.57847 Transcript_23594/m.57847 type:complete len:213 (+) Transcript_23594:428-1066(+)